MDGGVNALVERAGVAVEEIGRRIAEGDIPWEKVGIVAIAVLLGVIVGAAVGAAVGVAVMAAPVAGVVIPAVGLSCMLYGGAIGGCAVLMAAGVVVFLNLKNERVEILPQLQEPEKGEAMVPQGFPVPQVGQPQVAFAEVPQGRPPGEDDIMAGAVMVGRGQPEESPLSYWSWDYWRGWVY